MLNLVLMRTGQSPGTLATIKFPVTASLILGIIAVLAIICFALCPLWRETEKFGAEAIALTAGTLSAYYVGLGLKQTVLQREQALKDAQVSTASRFIERWNSPQSTRIKGSFREIIESGKAHTPEYVETLLKEDKKKRVVVVEVLNFFEEAALSANKGIADEETLKAFFRGMLNNYYTTLSAWIQEHRASQTRPMLWIELERMHSRWMNS
jgi:hypothetical protein